VQLLAATYQDELWPFKSDSYGKANQKIVTLLRLEVKLCALFGKYLTWLAAECVAFLKSYLP